MGCLASDRRLGVQSHQCGGTAACCCHICQFVQVLGGVQRLVAQGTLVKDPPEQPVCFPGSAT